MPRSRQLLCLEEQLIGREGRLEVRNAPASYQSQTYLQRLVCVRLCISNKEVKLEATFSYSLFFFCVKAYVGSKQEIRKKKRQEKTKNLSLTNRVMHK